LAARISDFSSLPAIPPSHYGPVAAAWQASPPYFNGKPVTLYEVAQFAKALLLSNPFGLGRMVPRVNLGDGGVKVVAVTQRQLAFVVANVLMGNSLPAGDGLSAALLRCSARPNAKAFIFSLLSFLAVLSQELADGSQGTFLIAATPQSMSSAWRSRLAKVLAEPTLCTSTAGQSLSCQTAGQGLSSGLSDFMSGGTPYQALTDIAGRVVGGGGALCETANSQDESLVQFYSEVLAFAFFDSGDKMLLVPWTLLGARRYVNDISGESSTGTPWFQHCGAIPSYNWLNTQILKQTVNVPLNGASVSVAASAFVAVKSKCASCTNTCPMSELMNNRCPVQRTTVDFDISLWYQAYEPSMYEASVQGAFATVVRRIGTGPWGAGVWYGDSQQYFLTVWLATSLLSNMKLDYYIYDHFCENPGNQCFLLGQAGCAACIQTAAVPGNPIDSSRCGMQSVEGIVQQFRGRTAQELYAALHSVGPPPTQVFDLIR